MNLSLYYLLAPMAFILGSIIGSFLNVVILRHNTAIKKNRSFCFSCGQVLKPIDMVPIFSYVLLRGKCRKCKSKISYQYFIVELVFAIVSVILLITTKNINPYIWFLKYLISLAFFATLTCIFVYDLKHKIMPDSWTLVALFLALGYSVLFGIGLKASVISAIIVGIPLLLINLISRGRAMGMGDVKFAPVMGILLGLSAGLSAMMISFWLGGIVGIYLLLRYRNNKDKKITSKTEIPFGPFLILATFITFVFRINLDTILTWFQTIMINSLM